MYPNQGFGQTAGSNLAEAQCKQPSSPGSVSDDLGRLGSALTRAEDTFEKLQRRFDLVLHAQQPAADSTNSPTPVPPSRCEVANAIDQAVTRLLSLDRRMESVIFTVRSGLK